MGNVADVGVRELVREDSFQLRRHASAWVDGNPDLPVEDPRDPLGNGDQREVGAPRVEDHDLRAGKWGAEELGELPGRDCEPFRDPVDLLDGDQRVEVEDEVSHLAVSLLRRQRELLARARQAPQSARVPSAQPLEVLPGQHRVFEAVQRVVDLPQHGIDIGRRTRSALLGELQIEPGEREVLRAHVGEGQLREHQAVVRVPSVGLFEKLDRAPGVAPPQIRRTDFGQLRGHLLRGGSPRRNAFRVAAHSSQSFLERLFDRSRRHGHGRQDGELETQESERAEHAPGQRTRKGADAWPPRPVEAS
jgi:hypothetical protein